MSYIGLCFCFDTIVLGSICAYVLSPRTQIRRRWQPMSLERQSGNFVSDGLGYENWTHGHVCFTPCISVPHFSVLHIPPLHFGAEFSSSAFSVTAFLMVPHFPVLHYPSPIPGPKIRIFRYGESLYFLYLFLSSLPYSISLPHLIPSPSLTYHGMRHFILKTPENTWEAEMRQSA